MVTNQLRNKMWDFFYELAGFDRGKLRIAYSTTETWFYAGLAPLLFQLNRIYYKIILHLGLPFVGLKYCFNTIFYLIVYKFTTPAMRVLKTRIVFLFSVLSIFIITSLGACTASRPSSAWRDVGHARELGQKKGTHSKRMQRRPANHR
jgi:hypothetical protein